MSGLLSLVLVLTAAPLSAADDDVVLQRSRLQLNRVIKELMDEKQALSRAKGEEKGLLAELDAIDRKLARTGERLGSLTRQRESAEKELPKLAAQVEQGRARVMEMRRRLQAHVRLMYGLGGQGAVKVALSQNDAGHLRQSVLYYGRLIKSRNARFKAFNESIQALNKSVSDHKALVAMVADLANELEAERRQELERRGQRKELLEILQRETEYRQQKVEELTLARSSLTSFMEKLAGALDFKPDIEEPEAVPAPSAAPKQSSSYAFKPGRQLDAAPEPRRKKRRSGAVGGRKITKAKGMLPPPVNARAEERKPGLFFRIGKNSPVRAVHGAQVVYADWFRGYGLLVILNHGDNIYSLYGHNGKLLVTPGDRVEANQLIAHTGDTGSLEGIPGLYFEIRRRGQVVNPKRWLASIK